MSPFFRHCVECPKCSTRYLIAFTPYNNGSYLMRTVFASSEEYVLYCSCRRPAVPIRWQWSEIRRYSVSKAAHDRGFGTPQEIVPADNLQRIERVREKELADPEYYHQKERLG